MRSQTGKQTIAVLTLPRISRSKCNQTMKFGLLIEYNTKNIFLEKSYTKCAGETIPRPSCKKLKLRCLWIHSLYFYTVCFYYMRSWGLSKDVKTKLHTTCFYLMKFFQKTKRGLELVSLPHFLHGFWKKKNYIIFY